MGWSRVPGLTLDEAPSLSEGLAGTLDKVGCCHIDITMTSLEDHSRLVGLLHYDLSDGFYSDALECFKQAKN